MYNIYLEDIHFSEKGDIDSTKDFGSRDLKSLYSVCTMTVMMNFFVIIFTVYAKLCIVLLWGGHSLFHVNGKFILGLFVVIL